MLKYLYLQLICQLILIDGAWGYCSGIGANPGFKGQPTVQQIRLTSVLVTWHGLVVRGECADQFLVKYWDYNIPSHYEISDLLTTDTFQYVVEGLLPGTEYAFQVVAREDKGLLGRDWNKSPVTLFSTSPARPTVSPATLQAHSRLAHLKADQESLQLPALTEKTNSLGRPPEDEGNDKPFSLVILAGLGILSIFILVFGVGVIYNLVRLTRRTKETFTSESSDENSLQLDMEPDVSVITVERQILNRGLQLELERAYQELRQYRDSQSNGRSRSRSNDELRPQAGLRDTEAGNQGRELEDQGAGSRWNSVRSLDTRSVAVQTRYTGCPVCSPVLPKKSSLKIIRADSPQQPQNFKSIHGATEEKKGISIIGSVEDLEDDLLSVEDEGLLPDIETIQDPAVYTSKRSTDARQNGPNLQLHPKKVQISETHF